MRVLVLGQVDILEPASLTSWSTPEEADNLVARTAFANFSKVQAKKFAGGKPMTPSGTRLAEEPYHVDLPAVRTWLVPCGARVGGAGSEWVVLLLFTHA